ncbi:MAG: Outer-membrane lipoprotein carrier protein [uncultured Sulfurovum sp.]|uniref:Outer-membrane lipoprotein carrier protein n=1 Tax=uncultured Sulfurovum sp. TaxID=269237 RepID=A0A6S6SMA0_9BACT|nr:MAG: Outer-membrane lipoprotein carrier protein [uncultured Sulfurovum sp.]
MKLLFVIITTTLLFLSTLHANSIQLPQSFWAHFTQIITNTKGKVIEYSGTMLFTDESHLKWSYVEPTKKEVCTDGVMLVVVDHDLEQISSYNINTGFNFTKIVKKATLHAQNIYVAKHENKTYTIQLNEDKLHSIAYYDDLENKVQIHFKEVQYGKDSLSEETMQCEAPKSYDMISG